jgi:uncharacterized damage-inducible protein DinB
LSFSGENFLPFPKYHTMSLNQSFIAELKQEAANTRKILERVPLDNADWKPHAKSMALGRLALHIAELPGWVSFTIDSDHLDLATLNHRTPTPENTEALLATHDAMVEKAVASLEQADDATLDNLWSLRMGEQTYFTMPKKNVLRTFAYSHLFHHRAQLGVYLRMLDIPVPGMYGPTADDAPMANN